MNTNMEDLLITCLDELESGVPLEQIIAHRPNEADAIRPILQMATSLQSLAGEPTVAARQNSAELFQAQATVLKRASRPRSTYWFRRFAVVFGIVVVLFVASLSIAQIASAALPGDPLYRVKRTSENVRLTVARDPELIQTEFAAERAEEVRELLQIGREEEAEYYGFVESIGPEAWLIGGVTVIVDANTKIEGAPAVGSYVEMEGTTRDGVLYASEIEITRANEDHAPAHDAPEAPALIDDDDEDDPIGATRTPLNQVTSTPTIEIMPTHEADDADDSDADEEDDSDFSDDEDDLESPDDDDDEDDSDSSNDEDEDDSDSADDSGNDDDSESPDDENDGNSGSSSDDSDDEDEDDNADPPDDEDGEDGDDSSDSADENDDDEQDDED
jgi:hypothetical protein